MNDAWLYYGNGSNVPKEFRTDSTHPRPNFTFFSFQRKRSFSCGILFALKFPYLRVVKFTTIWGLFKIYNGKLIFRISHIKPNYCQNRLYYAESDQKYTIEKSFFLKCEKNWLAGVVWDGPESFWDTENRDIWPLSIIKLCIVHGFWKKYRRSKPCPFSGQHGRSIIWNLTKEKEVAKQNSSATSELTRPFF